MADVSLPLPGDFTVDVISSLQRFEFQFKAREGYEQLVAEVIQRSLANMFILLLDKLDSKSKKIHQVHKFIAETCSQLDIMLRLPTAVEVTANDSSRPEAQNQSDNSSSRSIDISTTKSCEMASFPKERQVQKLASSIVSSFKSDPVEPKSVPTAANVGGKANTVVDKMPRSTRLLRRRRLQVSVGADADEDEWDVALLDSSFARAITSPDGSTGATAPEPAPRSSSDNLSFNGIPSSSSRQRAVFYDGMYGSVWPR
jgi:hypothetical protein